MPSIIAGTSGHIDHGKTLLVSTLTGIDTDRLAEEKRRGISIELGFAHLDLGAGSTVAFIDVPGHERFVKTMVAGATGIDLLLLVIAADESIKPQTREHFDICRMLNIRHGIVVLTKTDLVDRDLLELAQLEVEEFVAGSFLEGAPIVPVSAVTGEGLDTLKQKIREMAARIPARSTQQTMRLPIDRAFAMKGFGTVVTGTLIAGSIEAEQEVEIAPAGRRLRVRGVQVHGQPAKQATPGQRTAVNLAGIDYGEIARGMVLTVPGVLQPVSVLDCRIELLKGVKPLHARTQVHFHAGTAETTGSARPIGEGLARIRLKDPLMLLPGDRFILRQFSPVVTIGGGEVVEIDPPRKSRAARMAPLTTEERAALLVAESPHGLTREELLAKLGEPVAAGGAIGRWCVDAAWMEARQLEIVRALAAHHVRHPLLAGMPREELRVKTMARAPIELFDVAIERITQIEAKGDTVRLAGYKTTLTQDEQEARSKIEAAFGAGGLAVPAQRNVLAACGVDVKRAALLLNALLKEGRLVRVSPELVFHADAIGELKSLISLKKGQRFQVGEFKEWTGASRKYAIPLLEFLDRERITRRDGDDRVVV